MSGTMHGLDWLFAVGTLFFLLSAWGIGANDVANSYATSVSAKSLTLIQAGCLAVVTEFIGAIALGQQVTSTIRSGVFKIEPFEGSPGVLILANVIAEIGECRRSECHSYDHYLADLSTPGSATWLTLCTKMGFPVSTTQSIVGALVGVGIASEIHVNWGWQSGSVSQIAASWGIAPCIAAGFAAIIMMSIKVLVHWQKDPLKAGLRVITFYYGLTAGILTLFIVISGGHGIPTPEEMGTGKIVGIILGVFFGVWAFSATFFLPYYYRKLIREDARLRIWHIPMGPLLWKENPDLYWPGSTEGAVVPDYYSNDDKAASRKTAPDNEFPIDKKPMTEETSAKNTSAPTTATQPARSNTDSNEGDLRNPDLDEPSARTRQKDLAAIDALPLLHPRRLWATARTLLTYGVTRDIVGHQTKGLEAMHARAPQFDNKVEYLWTTAQVCSAMIMSVAHGASDVSNAIGPFTTEYQTWKSGVTSAKTDTPTWIKAVGGLMLGVGFWTYGYRKHYYTNLLPHHPCIAIQKTNHFFLLQT